MLIFLWNNRCRPLLGSKIWLKQWAKRIWTLSSLILFAWRIVYARRRGATIGEGTLLSAIHAGGNFRFLCIGQNSFIGRVEEACDGVKERRERGGDTSAQQPGDERAPASVRGRGSGISDRKSPRLNSSD